MIDPAQKIAELLESATSVLQSDTVTLPEPEADRLVWLQKLLLGKIGELQAILADLEGGLSIADLGYMSNTEFEDMVADLEVQITSLKTRIRSLREVGR